MTQNITLLVGALVAETQPVLRSMTKTSKLSSNFFLGYLGGSSIGLLTCGIGPVKAESATATALALIIDRGFTVERVVSFGTCGSLVDDLSIGDLVCAKQLALGVNSAKSLETLHGFRAVDVVTVDRPVTTNTGREQLASLGFHVCEMEAAGVYIAAAEIPFYVLKVVSDSAGGDPEDKVIAKGPRPVRIARFMIRARLLSEAHLVGALTDLVGRTL